MAEYLSKLEQIWKNLPPCIIVRLKSCKILFSLFNFLLTLCHLNRIEKSLIEALSNSFADNQENFSLIFKLISSKNNISSLNSSERIDFIFI